MRDGNTSSPTTTLAIFVNDKQVQVPQGTTLAAALLNAGDVCRISETGELRIALCGMGICFECRAIVDGKPHQRTCQIVCSEGMMVQTQR